jgi:hypothetical protein
LKLALCYISSLVAYGILAYFCFMQKVNDCDFFEWADKEMYAYEKRLIEHLKNMEERRHVNNDRLEKLIERKCKEQYDKLPRELRLCQNNKKMFRAMAFVIILLLVFYFSSYSGSRGTNLMLK